MNELASIIENNPHLKMNSLIQKAIFLIDEFIPEGSKQFFYENLKTLKLIKETKPVLGSYYPENNTLGINMEVIFSVLEKRRIEIDENVFREYLLGTLTHELLHLASSNLKEKKYGVSENENVNRSFNEGITEYFSLIIANQESISSYKLYDVKFVSLVVELLGIDFIKANYFNALGSQNIKTELSKLEKISRQGSKLNEIPHIIDSMCEYSDLANVVEKKKDSIFTNAVTPALIAIEKEISGMLWNLFDVRIKDDIYLYKISSVNDLGKRMELIQNLFPCEFVDFDIERFVLLEKECNDLLNLNIAEDQISKGSL